MPVLQAVRRLLLHLRQHVADDPWGVIRGLSGAGGVDGDVGEGGPGKGVVEVVFQEVVFGEIGQVGLLDVGDVGGVEGADVHCGCVNGNGSGRLVEEGQ